MEIDILTETQQLEDYWRPRNEQLKADRDFINLAKPTIKTGEVKWLSNEPKVQYDTAIAMISAYPPRFRLPLTMNYTPEEKNKISKTERFILGIMRELDRKQYNRGQSYWLREVAYYILSGWYAYFNVVKEENGNVVFVSDVLDPYTVYPEWDADSLVKCVRTYQVDKRQARAMIGNWAKKGAKIDFQEPAQNTDIKVINFWVRDNNDVYNTILVAGQVIKPFTKEPFKEIPLHVGTIGIPERVSENWQTRVGDSFVASLRDISGYENAIISLMVTILAETAYPNIATWTRTGAPAVKSEDMRGYGSVVPLKLEEKLELLKHAATPAEALQVLSWLQGKRQKAGFPDVVWGSLPFESSGFAISQLMAAIKYKVSPYLNALQNTLSQVMTDLLSQYRDGDFPKVKLSTTNPQEMKKGLFFVEEYSKRDVPDSLYIDVTVPITSSLDKTQQILFSRQALAPPQLLSRETLWDEVLDVQDSEQEYARILQDETLQLPVVKQIMMIEQLKQRARAFEAEGKLIESVALKKYIMMLEMQMGMRQGIPVTPGEAGNPSPSFSPPEMGQSPDMIRAAMGIGTPGLARRPQTPEERAQRKGGLVLPSGQPLGV